MASANGLINNNLVVNTLDGLTTVYTSGGAIDPTLYVKYADNTNNTDLGTFDLQTLGTLSAKQHVLPLFGSTIMTSPTTSSIFYAHSWKLNNTVGISSLGAGNYLSTSYLTIRDVTNASTLLTLQSDGIANFADTRVRVSTMASNAYDVVNLSTLTSAVAFIQNVNALNYVPYTNALQNLNMMGSTITTLGQINAGALRITSSVVNADYALSVNSSDQLEFTNLSNGSIFKTNGSDLFVTGGVNCAILGATSVEAGSNIYLAKGSTAEWRTTLGMSDQYEILDNAGVMRLRLSKTTGLTVSTLNVTQVPSATPTLALGVNGSGGVVSFAVPTAVNLLPLNNTWTGTNQFNNRVTLNTGTAQGSLTVYNSTDSLPGGGSGSALAIFAPTSTDSAIIFGCASNTTFAIRSTGSISNPTLALYSPTVAGMLTFTQNEATMTHGGNSFSLGNTRFLTSTVDSGVTSASVLAVSPTTISSAGGIYTALANSVSTEFRMRILANWIGGVNYTLTMVNTNWSNVKTPVQITVQSPAGTTIGSTFATLGGTSQVLFTYPQGANGNIYIYIYYVPLGATPTFTWTTLSVVANVLRSNLYSTQTAMAVNTTVPSFAGLALQSSTSPNGAGNETTIENFIVGDVSAGTKYPTGYSIGFNAGNLTANVLCQQASSGAGTTFYGINQQASYHSWKSQPTTANSVDMVLDYNAGSGGLRLNKNGASRTTGYILDANGTINSNIMTATVAGSTASNGSITLQAGNTTNTGFVEFLAAGGTRRSYIGYADSGNIYWSAEAGTGIILQTAATTRLTIAAGGLTTISAGLNVNGGAIECANQPFCIVGGVAGASVGYGVGSVWGAGSQLFAYTSAGMSNSGTSGWSAGAGAFFFTKTGRWQVNWSLYWNNFAGGSRGTLLHFNSAGSLLETRYCALMGAGIGSDTTMAYSTLIYGAAGDYLQCQFQSGSGTLYFGGITHTHVTFHFVA